MKEFNKITENNFKSSNVKVRRRVSNYFECRIDQRQRGTLSTLLFTLVLRKMAMLTEQVIC